MPDRDDDDDLDEEDDNDDVEEVDAVVILARVDSDLDFLKFRWKFLKSPPVYHINTFSSASEYLATCIVSFAESSNRTFLLR